MDASASTSSVINISDNDKWKTQFNEELLKLENDSSNDPLFTLKHYQQTIELISGVKLK